MSSEQMQGGDDPRIEDSVEPRNDVRIMASIAGHSRCRIGGIRMAIVAFSLGTPLISLRIGSR